MKTLYGALHIRNAGDVFGHFNEQSLSLEAMTKNANSDHDWQGRRVALCIRNPIALIESLVRLDGTANSMLLLSDSLDVDTITELCKRNQVETLVSDLENIPDSADQVHPNALSDIAPAAQVATDWFLTTSGTTGLPKIISHTFGSLTRTTGTPLKGKEQRWGLLFDPTRFAGMQVVLQALVGGGTLVATDTHAPLGDQISMLAKMNVTHLSATPSLWRRLLMDPSISDLPLLQITLGGEIADQPVLSALRKKFPEARITHIYASTEAGVGFSVKDGLSGFPAEFLSKPQGGTSLKVVDDILWAKPENRDLSSLVAANIDVSDDGYICTGDKVDLSGDRVLFLGRDNGSINVGGVKVFPELIERTILELDAVQLVQIKSKSNPIAGNLIVAEVLMAPDQDKAALKKQIIAHCREKLEREAVPAMVKFVEKLEFNAAGKLSRKNV